MDLIKNLFKGDKVIWIIFLFLCIISIIEVFSATSTLSYKSGNHWGPITQHTIFLLIGAAVVVVVHNLNYRLFQLIPFFLLPISAFMLLFVSIMGFITGDKVNGASRWMNLLGLQFQPSEFAKMAVIIYVSFILARNQEENCANSKAFKLILYVTGFFFLIIAPENLSTAGLLVIVVVLMMFIGRIEMKKMLKLLGVFAAAAVLGLGLIMLAPKETKEQVAGENTELMHHAEGEELHTQSEGGLPFLHRFTTWKMRLIRFMHPENVPAEKYDIDKNAQIAHARIAIATSNIIGKMPGNSVERDFLSQAFSDFIFAIIIEELGLIGGIFVVVLYIWLLIRAGRIAKKAKGNFASFLVMGIALLLVIQALINMCVAVGLMPVTGQPLPLISKGGTSTLINCAYIGMILSVSRYTSKLEEAEKEPYKTEKDTELNKEQIIAEEEQLSTSTQNS